MKISEACQVVVVTLVIIAFMRGMLSLGAEYPRPVECSSDAECVEVFGCGDPASAESQYFC